MSFRAVAWAFDRIKGLGQGEKLVLLALAEFANDEDETWRSREEIAKRAECSLRSVASHLKTLDEYGLISRVPRYSWCGDRSGACADKPAHKHRSGTTYRLHLDVVGDFKESTHANLAHVDFSAECSGCGHTCNSCTCGDDKASTHAKSGSPHMQQAAPICTYNPQLNPQTIPNQGEGEYTREVEPSGLVGSGLGESSSSGEPVLDASGVVDVGRADLLAQCLPAALQVLDAKGADRVVALLHERLEAGWSPGEIRSVMDQPLPGNVSRLASLVAYRLEQNVVPERAPKRLQSAAAASERDSGWGAVRARQRASEAIAVSTDDEGVSDPLWERAWREVEAENPGVSPGMRTRLVLARRAALSGGASA